MPRLLHGQTCMGVGATGVSVNDRLVIPGAGSVGWVSPSQLVCNGADAGNAVLTLPPAGPGTPLWTPGADVTKAGGGTIAAGLTNVGTRLRNSATPFVEVPSLLPLDVDRVTGTVLFYHQQEGRDLFLCYPDNPGNGQYPLLPTGPLYSARIVGGVVGWAEGTAFGIDAKGFNLNLGAPVAIETWTHQIYQPVLLPVQDVIWIVYSCQNGTLYAHPASDKAYGHMWPPANYFGLDAELQASGDLRIVSCANAGESAGSLQVFDVSVTALDPLSAPEDPLPAITHPCSVGVFFPHR